MSARLGVILRVAMFLVFGYITLRLLAVFLYPIFGLLIASVGGAFAGASIANALAIRIYERARLADIGLQWTAASGRNLLFGFVGGVGAVATVVIPSLLFGVAQAFALIPGVSRSGSTITAGRALGYTRASAARFSFLLSIPAVVLSGLFEARKLGEVAGPDIVPTIVGTVVAFVVGYASIAWLLRWLANHSMLVFGAYRVVLGVVILGLVYGGVLAAN